MGSVKDKLIGFQLILFQRELSKQVMYTSNKVSEIVLKKSSHVPLSQPGDVLEDRSAN